MFAKEFKSMLDAFDIKYEYYKTTSDTSLEDVFFRFDVQSKGGGSVGCFSEWNFGKDGRCLSVKHWDRSQEVGVEVL